MVISGVISKVTIIITHIRGLITPLITTHEPSTGVPRGWSENRRGGSPKLGSGAPLRRSPDP